MNKKSHFTVAHFHLKGEKDHWVTVDHTHPLVDDTYVETIEDLAYILNRYNLQFLEVDERPYATYYLFEINR